jgi:hypothetical protein
MNITICSGVRIADNTSSSLGDGSSPPPHPLLEAPMPNAERKPFVEPTLNEEASLAEITLVSGPVCTENCPG